MTYIVSGGAFNSTHSLTHSTYSSVCRRSKSAKIKFNNYMQGIYALAYSKAVKLPVKYIS